MDRNQQQSILVTGGAGFLGSVILESLQKSQPEWQLYSFDLALPQKSINGVTYLSGSVTEESEVRSALEAAQPIAIIHTAGLVPPLSARYARTMEKEVYTTNITGTKTILAAAQALPICRAFIWTSSITAVTDAMKDSYPNINETWLPSPECSLIYGESKARTEPLVLAANSPSDDFRTAILRPSVIFGRGDTTFLPSIHACIAKRETPFIIGSGLNLWDITDVRNVTHAHILAAQNLLSSKPTAAGEVFFITNEEPLPFRDICRQVWKLFDHYPPFEIHIPERVAWAAASVADRLGGMLGLPVTLSGGSVSDACATRYCDGDKARRILGYRPLVGLEEGLKEACDNYKNRLHGIRDTAGHHDIKRGKAL